MECFQGEGNMSFWREELKRRERGVASIAWENILRKEQRIPSEPGADTEGRV